jgi:hypothetical protein
MSAPSLQSAHESPAELIAGRYVWLHTLSQGGMGEVGEAIDMHSGKHVALKRLRDDGRELGALFRSEFHALSRLRHPNIVEVYEYGVDAGRPFYTMELLDGVDLREAAIENLTQCALHLRDVASSLSLLHAQRLLHRDVSPRNVRRTSQGRCKLFDFGTMTPFGVPDNIAGTRAFVSPEAWQGAALDQRADLYSLGALAYWLCTRTLPVPREVAPGTRPPRLNEVVPDVPRAFDALIMALLDPDPSRRPSSAAEVIAELNGIFDLPSDEPPDVARGYLCSTRFVGRRREMRTVLSVLQHTLESDGGSLLVEGVEGVGKSRLLAEARLLALPHGFQVWMGHGRPGAAPFSLAQDLCAGLVRMAPEAQERLDANERAALSLLVSGHGGARLTIDRALRAQLHGAAVALVRAAAKSTPWLLLVDDLHLADELSLAVVTACAHAAPHRALCVIATVHATHAAAGLASFAALGPQLTLKDLDAKGHHGLVSRLFGRVPHLTRVEAYLYRASSGNPGLTLELANGLLDAHVVRYAQGTFVLPDDDFESAVATHPTEHASGRLARLTQTAREVFALIALHHGEVSAELLLRMYRGREDAALGATDELLAAGLLLGAPRGYAIAKGALRNACLRSLAEAERSALHARLSAAIAVDAPFGASQALEAGFHALHTPQRREAALRLASLVPELVEQGAHTARAIEAGELALNVLEQAGEARAPCLSLRVALVRASYLYDERLAERYGPSTIEALEAWLCLASVERVLGFAPPALRLYVAWSLTFLRFWLTPRKYSGPSPHAAFVALCRALVSLLGVRVLKLDGTGAEALVKRIACLRGAPDFTSGRAAYHACATLARQPLGCEADFALACTESMRALDLNRARDMRGTETRDLRTGLLIADGINECYRAGSSALSRAALLEGLDNDLSRAAALRIALTYCVVRGDGRRADQCRKRLDLHAIEGGASWQVAWFAAPVEGYAAASFGDVLGVERAIVAMERIARSVPTLAFTVELLTLLYRICTEDFDRAIAEGERFVARTQPRSAVAWALGYAALARAYNAKGDHVAAHAVCTRALAAVRDADLAYEVRYGPLLSELAVALVGTGDLAAYAGVRDARRARLQDAHEHALLVLAEESHVRAMRVAGDRTGLSEALGRMQQAANCADTKQVSDFAQRVTVRHARASLRVAPGPTDSSAMPPQALEATEVQHAPQGPRASWTRGLLDAVSASGAGLVLCDENGVRLGPQVGDGPVGSTQLAASLLLAEQALAARDRRARLVLPQHQGVLSAVVVTRATAAAQGVVVLHHPAPSAEVPPRDAAFARIVAFLTKDCLDWESTDVDLCS